MKFNNCKEKNEYKLNNIKYNDYELNNLNYNDTLKIDKSFIDTVLTDSTSRVIMESIIELVKALGFESIAEGVENEKQYQYLHSIGCDVIQGYLLGKPLPTEEMEALIKEIV